MTGMSTFFRAPFALLEQNECQPSDAPSQTDVKPKNSRFGKRSSVMIPEFGNASDMSSQKWERQKQRPPTDPATSPLAGLSRAASRSCVVWQIMGHFSPAYS